MTIHALCQYILYRMLARGRHGTHSPFVYHFVEQVLRNKQGIRVATDTATLLAQLSGVYDLGVTDTSDSHASIVMLPTSKPEDWVRHISENILVLREGFVVLPAIHSTTQHTSYWHMASNLPSVTMSIDLYHTGILLSRPEFKEKQHFVLR